jgi:ubiquinone/menaquinone biosynthesis C-methylase UbiE
MRAHALTLLLLAAPAACARGSSGPAAPAVAPARPPDAGAVAVAVAAGQETSVRPDANTQYLRDDLAEWQRRFEHAGREIFDKRHDIVKAAGITPGMAVADVGAGTGLFTFLFAQAAGPRGEVYAVDIIPKFVAHIEAEARRRQASNVVPVLGGERSLSLPEGSVDLIFLCDTYHHFEYPRSMNASMLRALRPGGTLLLIDFHRVPGKTAAGVLAHVRAGQEVFTAELVAAGFVRVGVIPLLKENYVVRFAKPAR